MPVGRFFQHYGILIRYYLILLMMAVQVGGSLVWVFDRAGGVGGLRPLLGREGSAFRNSSHMHGSNEGVVWEGH